MIIQPADELYNTVADLLTPENEQYCRAALVLLDAYIDHALSGGEGFYYLICNFFPSRLLCILLLRLQK